MARTFRIGLVCSLVAMNLIVAPSARAAPVIDNPVEKVNGEGPRGGALQSGPDVSADGWVVWFDNRGTATTQRGSSVWSKDLDTRTETRVRELVTNGTLPRVSGAWVVWYDAVVQDGKTDVFARQLPPTGPVLNLNERPTDDQFFPVIDGTKVAWLDNRDFETTGTDIWMKDLAGGPEVLVTNAPGEQQGVEISGDLVVWTDRSDPADARIKGRFLSDPPGTEFVIADPDPDPDIEAVTPSVSGSLVTWSEGGDVKTCAVGPAGCTAPPEDVWTSENRQTLPHASGSDVVWLETEGGDDGPVWLWHRDVAGAARPVLVDAPPNGMMQWDEGGGPKIDGSLVAWNPVGFQGDPDIFWKDLASPDQPARANSAGLGGFSNQEFPSAGDGYVTYFADSGDFNPRNAVWATELSGDRRTIRVSSFADFGTAISPPKIRGDRVFWSDFRDSASGFPDVGFGPNVFARDLPAGPETRLTTNGIGNHPYPDPTGDGTAWMCDVAAGRLCVHRNGTITRYSLPATWGPSETSPYDGVDQQVRMSGGIVLWSEFDLDDLEPWVVIDSKVHALDVVTGVDVVLGEGITGPSWIPDYDIGDGYAAWVGRDGSGNHVVYRAPVDGSDPATPLFDGIPLSIQSVVMDGKTVAWIQPAGADEWGEFDWDVWLKDVTASTGDPGTQVTTSHTVGQTVWLHGGYAYWVDTRDEGGFFGDTDIYREYVGSPAPPPTLPADTTAPAKVTQLAQTASGAAIRVSWTNPTTPDLAGVIVVRMTKTGKRPVVASSFADPSSTIVFDGPGTSFLDSDVVAGVSYVYTAFTYDEVPNYSAGQATK